MKQEQHHNHSPQGDIFRPRAAPKKWAFFVLVWAMLWLLDVFLSIGGPDSPFLFLSFGLLTLGMFIFVGWFAMWFVCKAIQARRTMLQDVRFPREQPLLKYGQSYGAQERDTLRESSFDPQPFASPATWEQEQFQVQYPEQE